MENNSITKLITLKADAYDHLATIEFHQRKLAEVNQQIISLQTNPIQSHVELPGKSEEVKDQGGPSN